MPIRELLSEPFLRRVDCTSASLLHDRLSTIDEEDKAALDDLATHFTSLPTFGQLIGHATADWVLAKLKQKGIGGNAKVTTKAALPSPPTKPPATSEPLSDTKDESSSKTRTDAPQPANNSEVASQETPLSNDDLIFQRLEKLDPLAFQFAKEKDIRLIPRPKWSWAFEWTRTTFDVEERTDSSGTYFAFLYSPSLSDYQKLTYLISTIRADKGFKEWLEASHIVETKPSTISPAPGTPEYADYEKQLEEEQDAHMAEQGATPGEITTQHWQTKKNDWFGLKGLAWETLGAFGIGNRASKSGQNRSLSKPGGRRGYSRRKPRITTFVRDYATKATNNWSATFKSEGEARAFARTKLGKNPIEVEPGKIRSGDGKWQYRSKPDDLADNHIHLEQIEPSSGKVIQNLHLRWPAKGSK